MNLCKSCQRLRTGEVLVEIRRGGVKYFGELGAHTIFLKLTEVAAKPFWDIQPQIYMLVITIYI